MDAELFDALVKAAKSAHAVMGAQGRTTIPNLFVVDRGRPIAHVRVRPMHTGRDAFTALKQMATLVAAAGADELLLLWEPYDVAIACGLPTLGIRPCLNALAATAAGHVLHQFPYTEAVVGVLPDGLVSVEPRWETPLPPVSGAQLSPPVQGVVDRAFTPFRGAASGRARAVAARLESAGYAVNFFRPA